MIIEKLKRSIGGGLLRRANQRIRYYKSRESSINPNIKCVVSKNYNGAKLSAGLLTSDPAAGGFSMSGDDWFYQYGTHSVEQAFNELTKEVAECSLKLIGFNFIRAFTLQDRDIERYLISRDDPNHADWVATAMIEGVELGNVWINERYANGSWLHTDDPWL